MRKLSFIDKLIYKGEFFYRGDNSMIQRLENDQIRVSVRNLVEFILRSGDLDNRRSQAPENAMQEGSKIHRMIQKRMGLNYEAEVMLKTSCAF